MIIKVIVRQIQIITPGSLSDDLSQGDKKESVALKLKFNVVDVTLWGTTLPGPG